MSSLAHNEIERHYDKWLERISHELVEEKKYAPASASVTGEQDAGKQIVGIKKRAPQGADAPDQEARLVMVTTDIIKKPIKKGRKLVNRLVISAFSKSHGGTGHVIKEGELVVSVNGKIRNVS
jgi:hypothetical protein